MKPLPLSEVDQDCADTGHQHPRKEQESTVTQQPGAIHDVEAEAGERSRYKPNNDGEPNHYLATEFT